MEATGRYERVIATTLIAEATSRNGVRVLGEVTATKQNIRSVLRALAGEQRHPGVAEVAPDDVLVVAFSGHGYADDDGEFYLFPFDIGKRTGAKVTSSILDRSIAGQELANWLRRVDAGEIALIIDACHSAAAVEGSGFKPGPASSRGLGQLAYDKRMRFLASTRAGALAWETRLPSDSYGAGHGLLSEALIGDGLVRQMADHRPAGDGLVGLSEWLRFGAGRVPTLYDEMIQLELERKGRFSWILPRDTFRLDDQPPPAQQRPTFFDFRRSGIQEDPVIAVVTDGSM